MAPLLLLGGAALGAGAGVMKGQAEEAQAKAEAANLRAQADADAVAADEESRVMGIKREQTYEEGQSMLGETIARLSAGGVSAGSGTANLVKGKIAKDIADQMYEYSMAGSRAVRMADWQRRYKYNVARFTERQGRRAFYGSLIGAGGTALTGLSKASQLSGGGGGKGGGSSYASGTSSTATPGAGRF